MKITREEIFRQLRARGTQMIEDWIESACKANMPGDLDVGEHLQVVLCLHPAAPKPRLQVPENGRLSCEVSGCERSVEFGGDQPPEEGAAVWRILYLRGWRVVDEAGAQLLVCPQHAPAGTSS